MTTKHERCGIQLRLASTAFLRIVWFINSKAFEENAFSLINAIEGFASKLPNVVPKLPIKAVELHQADKEGKGSYSRWWTNDVAKLVLRLYEQTPDEERKTQCLNVLDRMIELNFGNFNKELEKVTVLKKNRILVNDQLSIQEVNGTATFFLRKSRC